MTEPVAEAGGEFVLVPREPTKAMIQASFDSMKPYKFRELTKRKKVQARWAAMLAAAPATSAPATLRGMIAAIYEGMDAEDSARIDREWRDFRALSAPSGDGEAEKLAQRIERRKFVGANDRGGGSPMLHFTDHERQIILDALRRAQPPQPTGTEPVAYGEFYGEKCASVTLQPGRHNTVPLYAHPPAQPTGDVGTRIKLLDKVQEVLERRFPMCRDCADNDGTCEGNGLPCDLTAAFDDLRGALRSADSRSLGLAQDREIELLRKLEAAANRATTAEARVAELEKAVNEACDIAIGASDDMTRTAKQRIDDLRKIAALSPTELADKKKE